MAGFYPLFHTIDAFMVRRAYEQIYLDLGLQRLPALLVSGGFNNDYQKLGPTHHCPESKSMLRNIPGLMVLEPDNDEKVATAIALACSSRSFAYIRLRG